MLKKVSIALGALLVLAAVVIAIPLRRVTTDEMFPTLKKGDWVWIVPVTPLRGDVVLVADPHDPDRDVLRRSVAHEEMKVRWEEGSFRINGKRVRQQEETAAGDYRYFKETIWSKPPARATTWWIRRRAVDDTWKSDPIELPAGTWYLTADDREEALDSRWWGPIPQSDIKGVVRFRYGPADERRPGWEWMQGTE